ncbi:hypothetical protein [Streptomyces meridianus]|uniref:Uncharacterized protein n=1 Tax=Streptomyces meridianus TaxID=2938945 RepID=A0ABT0X9R0_9ACTN|nr:hypothetical protein [Streptomyces meridianus]MCM2579261.1 hypothetical protein [Streptomyces meridianus]
METNSGGRNRSNGWRELLREAPSTVALLVDEQDFTAMTGYRTFKFADHEEYLGRMEALLRALESQGVHTTVAVFDPGEFTEFCEEHGLDPDATESRTRYTAGVAASGATVVYDGRPVRGLLPLLVDEAARRATFEYATDVLARAGGCDRYGEDIGHAAYLRASQALMRLAEVVEPGVHHAVCSVPADGAQLVAVLHAECAEPGKVHIREWDALVFCTVLAVAVAEGGPGGVVLRSSTEDGRDTVRGWSLRDGWLRPLTEAEVFSAYCTDAETGEPVPPEPGVDYRPGLTLPPPDA